MRIPVPLWVVPCVLLAIGIAMVAADDGYSSTMFDFPSGRQLLGCLLIVVTIVATVAVLITLAVRA